MRRLRLRSIASDRGSAQERRAPRSGSPGRFHEAAGWRSPRTARQKCKRAARWSGPLLRSCDLRLDAFQFLCGVAEGVGVDAKAPEKAEIERAHAADFVAGLVKVESTAGLERSTQPAGDTHRQLADVKRAAAEQD